MSHFVLKKIVCQKSKQAAFHPGPVLPPSGEGSPLRNIVSGYCYPTLKHNCPLLGYSINYLVD